MSTVTAPQLSLTTATPLAMGEPSAERCPAF
ncbi:MAG: hypothetical protein ACI9U2_000113 [Bradymonadia bacterium]|jgi:hypothetical protein